MVKRGVKGERKLAKGCGGDDGEGDGGGELRLCIGVGEQQHRLRSSKRKGFTRGGLGSRKIRGLGKILKGQ